MDVLNGFLKDLCRANQDEYKFEQVENLAEVYRKNDVLPAALIEYRSTVGFIIRFRIGLSARDIARLSRDMTEVETSLVFDEDFLIDPQYGYLYGEEATAAFIQNIQKTVEEANMADAMDGAIYVSSEPIIAYGSNIRSKTKIEKFWGDEL